MNCASAGSSVKSGIHDDRCATLQGHPCNCASSAMPSSCDCGEGECKPQDSEGRVCFLSGYPVPLGYFPKATP